MEDNKKNNYKSEILNVLEESPMGLTITEISKKTGKHRNTVSKYVNILEAEGMLDKKEISAARVYFSEKRQYLPRNLMASFIQALFYGLKDSFLNKEEELKGVGRKLLEHFRFPISKSILREFDRVRDVYEPQEQLKLFQEFYNAFDLFQDDLDIDLVELNQTKAVYRLKNSDFLDPAIDSAYFFYLACGITEVLYLKMVNRKVECNIENIYLSGTKEDSYIEVSIELQD